jgi:hypothetical protein
MFYNNIYYFFRTINELMPCSIQDGHRDAGGISAVQSPEIASMCLAMCIGEKC